MTIVSDSNSPGAPPRFMAWPLLIGGSAFAAGFFGPMIFMSDSNIGPIIGVLITGPAGVVLGLVLGLLMRWINAPPTLSRRVLVGSATIGALSVLAFCVNAPHPKLRGSVIEAQIDGCVAPMESAQEAIAFWDKRIGPVTWAKPRAGWREDVPRLLTGDGVVLELKVQRQNRVYEQRKFWNRGQLRASGWQPSDEPIKRYYARFAGDSCRDYRVGETAQYFPVDEASADWPPSNAASFLDLLLLQPVPSEIRRLL